MSTTTVAELMERASLGDQDAWNGLVERFERLVWSIIRGFRLDEATTRDVSQTVWLRFVENLGKIRSPEAVGSWLATTARRESIRVSKARRRMVPVEFEYDFEDTSSPSPVERLIDSDEQMEALEAFSQLSDVCQELIRLLIADPPLDYETISAMTGRPIGAIGPTRGRCLDRLRRLMEAR
jgi:RNA polymerase sigma factor (sigma-70 family)